MRAIDAIVGQTWVIEPAWLEMIGAIAQRQFDAPVVAAMQGNAPRAADLGVAVVDGVAVIGIVGPIFPRANMMTENSGATSLANIQSQFRLALADPSVRSIVFNIDSPGGAVTGIADFAAEVKAARAIKPIVAVAGGNVASGAYWIASAASQLVVSSTAVVGSIGVVVGMTKQVAPDSQGRVAIEIVSSNAPDKRTDPTDSAGRAAIVAMLDAVEAEFLSAVAANRGVSIDTVKSDFGKGGVRIGAQAITAGMADRIGTIDSVLTGLAAAGPVTPGKPRAAAAALSEQARMNPTSIAELTAAFPDLVAQIRNEALASASSTATAAAIAAARGEGATAERARILGIEAAALPGHEALVATLKADGTISAGDAAIAIMAAENAKRGTVLAQLQADGKGGAPAAPAPQPPAAAQDVATILADKSRPVADRCKAAFDLDAETRATFGTVEKFTAYQSAVEGGNVRQLRR
jgi:capsid assembly protease